MPDITITVGAALATKLTAKKDAHNNLTGASFTVAQWITFWLREQMVAEMIQGEVEGIQRQAQLDMTAALQAKKTELMGQV